MDAKVDKEGTVVLDADDVAGNVVELFILQQPLEHLVPTNENCRVARICQHRADCGVLWHQINMKRMIFFVGPTWQRSVRGLCRH
jgi:hypothetical protein